MRSVKRTTTVVVTLSTALALGATATATTAGAAVPGAKPQPSAERVLNRTVLAPYQIALRGGKVYYSDGFAGTLNKLGRRGPKVIAKVNGGEIAGVEFAPRKMAYTSSIFSSGNTALTIRRKGRAPVVADLDSFEKNVNPDRNVTYGILSGGTTCTDADRDKLKELTGHDPTYKGAVDSHPYQVEALRNGSWAVAEAAGNAILRVNKRGQVSTLALLPRQPVVMTAARVAAVGAPVCYTGATYAFEPVPTDVERDGHGNLWVSTLPGGPESPALGARGSVYKINRNGVRRVATGFLGATNLALAGGKVYVAELFNNRVSTIWRGHIVTARSIPRPLSVEATHRHLYVGQMADIDFQTGNPKGPGGIYRFRR